MDSNDFLYYGMMQEEKSSKVVEQFNERWKRLGDIHDDISEKFVNALLRVLSNDDNDELMPHIEDVLTWQKDINERLDIAEDKHLSEYAMHLKNTMLTALKLCKKYGIYNDIESFEYSNSRQMIVLNGDDLYFLG